MREKPLKPTNYSVNSKSSFCCRFLTACFRHIKSRVNNPYVQQEQFPNFIVTIVGCFIDVTRLYRNLFYALARVILENKLLFRSKLQWNRGCVELDNDQA